MYCKIYSISLICRKINIIKIAVRFYLKAFSLPVGNDKNSSSICDNILFSDEQAYDLFLVKGIGLQR